MDPGTAFSFVSTQFSPSVLPAFLSYLKIPSQSSVFDPAFLSNGYIDSSISVLEQWTTAQQVAGLSWEVLSEQGAGPMVYINVEATGDAPHTVVLYGHLDKQPGLGGWMDFCGPQQPALQAGKLYGRGAADDGFAAFAAVLAVKACQVQQRPHPRCVVLLETEEESGSPHFPLYLARLLPHVGQVSLVLCLDSSVYTYDRLWVTGSMRGSAAMDVKVGVMNTGVHSGDSGIVPSSFRVIRGLVGRVEDPATGQILLTELHTSLPPSLYRSYSDTAAVIGPSWMESFPLVSAPLHADLVQLLLNQSWRPSLTITGFDGLPPSASAGNVLRPYTTARIAVRLPPTIDPQAAVAAISTAMTTNPPSNAAVTIANVRSATGWVAPALPPALDSLLNSASEALFGNPAGKAGAGGTIPVLSMLHAAFPQAAFLVTGVLGPGSNAHSPNESLDVDYFLKLTAAVAVILSGQ